MKNNSFVMVAVMFHASMQCLPKDRSKTHVYDGLIHNSASDGCSSFHPLNDSF